MQSSIKCIFEPNQILHSLSKDGLSVVRRAKHCGQGRFFMVLRAFLTQSEAMESGEEDKFFFERCYKQRVTCVKFISVIFSYF